MTSQTDTLPVVIDRAAEADRYTRYGRTADRLRRMTRGEVRTYRGHYPHYWHSLANATRRYFVEGTR